CSTLAARRFGDVRVVGGFGPCQRFWLRPPSPSRLVPCTQHAHACSPRWASVATSPGPARPLVAWAARADGQVSEARPAPGPRRFHGAVTTLPARGHPTRSPDAVTCRGVPDAHATT